MRCNPWTTFRASIVISAMALGLWTAPSALGPAEAAAKTQDNSTNGDAEAFTPNEEPTLQVIRAPGAIVVDGELDDAGWVGAARATNFSENWPREKAKPPVESEAWVTYDDDYLYLAFLAHDDPGTLRASLRDRDEMWSDDYFGILLDTYGDAAWAYFLFANPLGVQGDSRFATTGGEDDGFDIIYHSEAKVTDEGYQIEMAIPFESLRFPNRPIQTWRATFWRTRPRGSRATYTWAAMDRDEPCFLCQFGTLTGIEGVKPGGALELLPAVVTSRAGELRDADDPNSGIDDGSIDGQLSLGARYAFASGLTAEGTFNPDFSQVESDVGQIDVNTTFALFFPERRPFFQEGSDLFDTYFDVVYTRQINDPQFATKFVARLGRTNFGYLGARDEHSPLLLPFEEQSFVGQAGRSISNIARVRQTFLKDSYVGALIADRRFEDGGSGTTAGVDGLFRFLDNYRLEYQILASHTDEPNDLTLTDDVNDLTFDRGRHTAAFDGESYWGYAQYTSLERSARFWQFDFDYWASSPTFRADDGFETRNDFRRVSMWQGIFIYTNTKVLDRILPNVYMQRSWNFDGVRKNDFAMASLEFSLKGDTYVDLEYSLERERFGGIDFDGMRAWFVYVNSNFSDPLRMGFWIWKGNEVARNEDPPILGDETTARAWATIKPISRFVIQPELQFSKLTERHSGPELFSGYIFRTRTNFQFTRELFLRLIVEYNDFSESLSVEPLLTWKLNPFTLFYIGSTQSFQGYNEPDRFALSSRQYFAKFQYLFRR